MLPWDLDYNNPPVTRHTWLRAIARSPKLIRHYPRWRKSLSTGASDLNDQVPAFVYEAADWLDAYLKPEMKVFEWGSGGLTLFFAHRAGKVVSAEHDPGWYARVSEALHSQAMKNVTLVLCEPDKASPGNEQYLSIDERYAGLQFLYYAGAIDGNPDNTFDLVSVDGRARPACIMRAAAKVRPGGYLLLDDSDRDRYIAGKRLLTQWKERRFFGPKPCSNLCSSTTVWQKPETSPGKPGSISSVPLQTLPLIRPRRHAFEMEADGDFIESYAHQASKPLVINFLTNLLNGTRLFVDVGARSGFYSLLAAGRNQSIEVLSLEPDKANFDVLTRNITRNDLQNIQAIQQAPWKDSGSGLEALTIDALLKSRPSGSTIIRISAAGHELEVLEGMHETVSRSQNVSILLELNLRQLERAGAGESSRRVADKLHELGLDIYSFDQRRSLIAKGAEWDRFADEDGSVTFYCPKQAQSLSVCFFSLSSTLGGTERSILELATQLIQDYGCVCTVVLPTEGPLRDALMRIGVTCVVIPYRWWCDFGPVPPAEASRRLGDSVLQLLAGPLDTIATINPDVVVTFSMVIPWGAVSAALIGKPHVWHICEYGSIDYGLHFFHPHAEVMQIIRESSTALLTNSDTLRRSLLPDVPADECVTLYRHITIPPPDPDVPVENYYSRAGAVRLAVVGMLCEGKGQEDAVRATAELINTGYSVELLLAGPPLEEYQDRLMRLIHELGMQDRVHLPGYVQDVYSAMRQTDIIVICSRNEAFGRVAVEGMLLGKPVVYTNSGAFPEYMIDGETGLAYSPGDWIQLADRIRTVLENPQLRHALATRGPAYAQERFARQQYGGKAFAVFHKLKGGSSTPVAGRLFGLTMKALLDERKVLLQERADINKTLANIQQTIGWKLLRTYWRLVDGALRPGSRPRWAFDKIFDVIRSRKAPRDASQKDLRS